MNTELGFVIGCVGLGWLVLEWLLFCGIFGIFAIAIGEVKNLTTRGLITTIITVILLIVLLASVIGILLVVLPAAFSLGLTFKKPDLMERLMRRVHMYDGE